MLLALLAIALGLRLLAWRWHELYDLGGDESEYFNQALRLLREHTYVELNLMRPPLYTGFLAACMYLFDSLVQRLRLVQAVISALTVVPVYLLTRRLFDRRVALLAALLAALDYTMAAHAAELLTETLFVFGLTTLFWLLLAPSGDGRAGVWAGLAGLNLGALALIRSVALPLLPLGALWLLLSRRTTNGEQRRTWRLSSERRGLEAVDSQPPALNRQARFGGRWSIVVCFVLGATLAIGPWTIRNFITYGALIVVDTTGAENLWLDNNPAGSTPDDPLGREAAKQQLYALGDDRAARQRVAAANGAAAILSQPAWFVRKAWSEAQQFFALEYFDDLRQRRAIWVAPLEVWLRLLLGDGLWLVLLLGGTVGLWLAPAKGQAPSTRNGALLPVRSRLRSSIADPRWLFVPWALYMLLSAMLFHVELRYRLPLYPVLLPYAAWALIRIAGLRLRVSNSSIRHLAINNLRSSMVGAALSCLLIVGLTLLHQPYIGETWMLARKHYQLSQAERALAAGNAEGAAASAGAALELDPDSALARVALARAALAGRDQAGALAALGDAIDALKAHPHAHLLRGAILREQADAAGARAEFKYEKASLEDLQSWSWATFASFASLPTTVEIGRMLDLGYVRGFWLPEQAGFRWTKSESLVRLAAPQAGAARLDLNLSSGRPAGAPPPQVAILIDGSEVGHLVAEAGWRSYSFDIPAALIAGKRQLTVTLRSDTFRPRAFDRASPDDRMLGVMLRSVAIQAP